jgi:hypothetical protein
MEKIIIKVLSVIIFALIILVIIGGDSNRFTDYDFPEPDSVYAKYFPLNVGNKFVYLNSNFYPGQTWVTRAVIAKDSTINGKKYFYCVNFPYISAGWVRFDTAKGNLIQRSAIYCSSYTNDIVLDSMRSKPNDQVSCLGTKRCLDTNNITLFNQFQRKTLSFRNDGIIYQETKYARDFGIISGCQGEPPPCDTYYSLKGCVINGIVYGDTTMTNISYINSKIPDKYSLYQNYPNPFNPSTIIRFNIPKLSSPHALRGDLVVTLKVFNILGKEVATLVNEKLKPGEYETTFDASALPSGIYLYNLSTDNFKETKKMLMVK